ncbi:MAG: peptidase M3 [bacterium TMED88]|nr:peptidase M3 [Deltaproteobacteria bacterium]OUV34446.1 MAG: peptidase M3 [bacterium TMED88]
MESQTLSAEEYPLLDQSGLPRFGEIGPEDVEPAVRQLLEELGTELEALEASVPRGYEPIIGPLEAIHDRLALSWGIVGHLMGVQNSDALREAHDAVQSEVVAFGLRLGQSQELYRGLVALREGPDFEALTPVEKRVVEGLIREATHAGVALEGAEQARFQTLAQELAQLATQFSQNVLEATRTFARVVSDPAQMEGTPETLREITAQSARSSGEPDASSAHGPWRLTLDAPSLVPYLEHGPDRSVREELYRAHVSKASAGAIDNAPLIDRILILRREMAELLGYANYAELSLASKMAPDSDAVKALLEKLRLASFSAAQDDLEEIQRFAHARDQLQPETFRPWDVAYYAERVREARFDYSEEDLRPYFPFDRVLEGLFGLAKRLFDVEIEPADGEAAVWHPDVRFFRVRDHIGRAIAFFYLDAYSRPGEKRGGAWMDECVGRSRRLSPVGEEARRPVAYLVCNQTPPVQGQPALMSFSEIETLFHEFGHGLQHMLTRVDEGLASGIRNIEWDAVELPSQFMENWCIDRRTLSEISGHVVTGEQFPDDLFEKIRRAQTFRSASAMLRQLEFALTDLFLHGEYLPGKGRTPFDVRSEIAERTSVLAPLPEDRFLCGFGHIFAGGYAAGYYSYKWAEVLSADAFGAFEEAGLENEKEVKALGLRFRESVLAQGGSRAPMDVFVDFRGRSPQPEALLRHSGLLDELPGGPIAS